MSITTFAVTCLPIPLVVATEDHKRSDPVAVAPKDIATDRYDCDLDSDLEDQELVDEPDSSPAHILEMKELAQHLMYGHIHRSIFFRLC